MRFGAVQATQKTRVSFFLRFVGSNGSNARSDQVETPGREELAQDQLLEHDLVAKVVSTFADHALALQE
jgi:hypothetical protein